MHNYIIISDGMYGIIGAINQKECTSRQRIVERFYNSRNALQ